ncbi:MAG: TetR/AcrR family transcriptional regulator [Phenylobacterium sp.]|uniref:TetR/AcrR family transcriptional regulator n=1 Tax=Phenylobacterium sp. TaxID=1871053 RepID=UPI001A5DEF95|nr:TetR/AcrR family transcriptional regulator [Phenylobacterium sp.]MBL8553351.1 TetR/AcrR family transcriptional regulator [Phenylobacterium sp.]
MSGQSGLGADDDAEGATGAAPLGRREAGKAERRRRIIHAARDLIRETGNAGLSMRALAARAGVSLATPYNLFGSKRAIVLAVLDDVRVYQDRSAHLTSTDPLERLFAAVDMAIEFYVDDPQFYKTLWAAVFDASDDVRSEIYNQARNEFWRHLVEATVEAGAIAEGVDVELLFKLLDRCFGAAMLEWVVGELSPDLLAPTIRHSYALVLKGAASAGWRDALDARLQESQARILRG